MKIKGNIYHKNSVVFLKKPNREIFYAEITKKISDGEMTNNLKIYIEEQQSINVTTKW